MGLCDGVEGDGGGGWGGGGGWETGGGGFVEGFELLVAFLGDGGGEGGEGEGEEEEECGAHGGEKSVV